MMSKMTVILQELCLRYLLSAPSTNTKKEEEIEVGILVLQTKV